MIKAEGSAVMIKGTTVDMLAEATGILVGVYRNLHKTMPDEVADKLFATMGRVAVSTANDEDGVVELMNIITKGDLSDV